MDSENNKPQERLPSFEPLEFDSKSEPKAKMPKTSFWDISIRKIFGEKEKTAKVTSPDALNSMATGCGQSEGAYPPFGCRYFSVPKYPFRKRHPFLFWIGIAFCVFFFFNVVIGITTEVFSGPKIAIVNIEGVILGSRDVNKWIEKVRKDPKVVGVLLRVDSSGGAVGASQEIYYAISRLAKEKPVVTSMGSVAASGGYYVSLPAKRIFAVPSTLTGSIGVKMSLTNVEELMKMVGVSSTTLATGNLKDAGTPFREMTPEEHQYLQSLIDDMFNDFVNVVAKHRRLFRENVLAVADGRGITGRQALEVKLIDELGDMQDALSYLKKECGIDPYEEITLVEGPEEGESSFLRRLILSTLQNTLGQSQQKHMFFY